MLTVQRFMFLQDVCHNIEGCVFLGKSVWDEGEFQEIPSYQTLSCCENVFLKLYGYFLRTSVLIPSTHVKKLSRTA